MPELEHALLRALYLVAGAVALGVAVDLAFFGTSATGCLILLGVILAGGFAMLLVDHRLDPLGIFGKERRERGN